MINASALLMLFFGVLGKFGAIFVSIPDPIIGGTSAALFGKSVFTLNFKWTRALKLLSKLK